MGTLLITDQTGPKTVPLSSSTLVGRHFVCSSPIDDPAVPLYWLEIRWTGDIWVWRTLSGSSRTRGAGAVLEQEWREFKWSNGRGGRIVWDERCTVELVDPTPPQLTARWVNTQEWIDADELLTYIEFTQDGFHAVYSQSGEPLKDGHILSTPHGPLQVYLPTAPRRTDASSLSIANEHLTLDVNLSELKATFTSGRKEVCATGECVRVLAAYAYARTEQRQEDSGWLLRSEAHKRWVHLGGKAESPEARIAWERGKLRTQLSKQAVSDVSRLFHIEDRDGHRMSRLSIPGTHITIS